MPRTKRFKITYIITSIISFLLMVGPLTFYSIKAFLTTGVMQNKFVLSSMILVVIILTVLCALREYKPRSTMWLILVGLWAVLDSLGGIIIAFTITQVLDEFLVSPIKKYSKRIYSIRREQEKT